MADVTAWLQQVAGAEISIWDVLIRPESPIFDAQIADYGPPSDQFEEFVTRNCILARLKKMAWEPLRDANGNRTGGSVTDGSVAFRLAFEWFNGERFEVPVFTSGVDIQKSIDLLNETLNYVEVLKKTNLQDGLDRVVVALAHALYSGYDEVLSLGLLATDLRTTRNALVFHRLKRDVFAEIIRAASAELVNAMPGQLSIPAMTSVAFEILSKATVSSLSPYLAPIDPQDIRIIDLGDKLGYSHPLSDDAVGSLSTIAASLLEWVQSDPILGRMQTARCAVFESMQARPFDALATLELLEAWRDSQDLEPLQTSAKWFVFRETNGPLSFTKTEWGEGSGACGLWLGVSSARRLAEGLGFSPSTSPKASVFPSLRQLEFPKQVEFVQQAQDALNALSYGHGSSSLGSKWFPGAAVWSGTIFDRISRVASDYRNKVSEIGSDQRRRWQRQLVAQGSGTQQTSEFILWRVDKSFSFDATESSLSGTLPLEFVVRAADSSQVEDLGTSSGRAIPWLSNSNGEKFCLGLIKASAEIGLLPSSNREGCFPFDIEFHYRGDKSSILVSGSSALQRAVSRLVASRLRKPVENLAFHRYLLISSSVAQETLLPVLKTLVVFESMSGSVELEIIK